MKTGRNLLKTAMLILVSIIISQSAMAENFPTNEYFLYGDWKVPYFSDTVRLYQDHTTLDPIHNTKGTWSYDANTGTVLIYKTPNYFLKLIAESRTMLSGHLLNPDGEVQYGYTVKKVQVDCEEEDYNNDGSFDLNDFIDNEYDVKYDFKIRRQNLDTEIERQNLDKELETELEKIRQKLQSCWVQKCD